MTEVKVNIDVGALATPITRIVDLAGRHLDPYCIRRTADAEAYARLVAAKAEMEIEALKDDAEIARFERAMRGFARMLGQLEREQGNLEAVFEKAKRLLPASGQPGTVDDGWAGTLIDSAKNATHDWMREVFAKLLAREVTSPGACSRRLLRIAKELSHEDALLFERACRQSVRFAKDPVVVIPMIEMSNVIDALSQDDVLGLVDCGLMAVHLRGWQIFGPETLFLPSGRRTQISGGNGQVRSFYSMTQTGTELASVLGIVGSNEDDERVLAILHGETHRFKTT